MKNKTFLEKLRTNPWMMGTFILGAAFILMNVYNLMKVENEINELTNDETLCSKINSTPAWFDWMGNLITEGYINFQGNEEIVDFLISEKIHFVYNSNCGWCQKQIKEFMDWERYVESGYTVKCN